MYNVTIKNKHGQVVSDQNLYENTTEYINHIVSTNYFGKPERWVKAKILIPSEDVSEVLIDFYPDEVYTSEDVIETEFRNEFGESIEYVKLKAEYTIEVTDVTEALAKEARIKEIKALLLDLDLKAIRPLLESETDRIEEIKAEKLTLRNELNSLTN